MVCKLLTKINNISLHGSIYDIYGWPIHNERYKDNEKNKKDQKYLLQTVINFLDKNSSFIQEQKIYVTVLNDWIKNKNSEQFKSHDKKNIYPLLSLRNCLSENFWLIEKGIIDNNQIRLQLIDYLKEENKKQSIKNKENEFDFLIEVLQYWKKLEDKELSKALYESINNTIFNSLSSKRLIKNFDQLNELFESNNIKKSFETQIKNSVLTISSFDSQEKIELANILKKNKWIQELLNDPNISINFESKKYLYEISLEDAKIKSKKLKI